MSSTITAIIVGGERFDHPEAHTKSDGSVVVAVPTPKQIILTALNRIADGLDAMHPDHTGTYAYIMQLRSLAVTIEGGFLNENKITFEFDQPP